MVGLRSLLDAGEIRFLGVRDAPSGKLVGLLLYNRPYGFDYYEVGFYIIPSARRKGYGSEAMRLLVKSLFRKGIERIEASTSSLNAASQKALEKAGFKKEACFRKTLLRDDVWEDSVVYAFYRTEKGVTKSPADRV